MGCDHKVTVAYLKVAYRRSRQVSLQCLPVTAVVEGDVDASLCAAVEQPAMNWVLPYDVDGVECTPIGDAVGTQCPG